jgi:hypothetical protein
MQKTMCTASVAPAVLTPLAMHSASSPQKIRPHCVLLSASLVEVWYGNVPKVLIMPPQLHRAARSHHVSAIRVPACPRDMSDARKETAHRSAAAEGVMTNVEAGVKADKALVRIIADKTTVVRIIGGKADVAKARKVNVEPQGNNDHQPLQAAPQTQVQPKSVFGSGCLAAKPWLKAVSCA